MSAMRTRKALLAVTAAICVSGGLGACSSSAPASGSAAGSGTPIPVGSVVPLTGSAAAVAGQYSAGIQAAIDAANDAGGVNGRKIELTTVDDGFQTPRTIAGIRELAQRDHVVGIIGPYGTNAAQAARPVADQVKVPLIGPLAYAAGFYQPVDMYTYALWPSQEQMFNAVTSYAITEKGAKRVAIVAIEGEVGDETVAGAEQALSAHGMSPIKVIRVQNGAADYSGTMAQVKDANPDSLVLLGDTPSMAKMAGAAQSVGLNVPIYGSVSAGDAGFAKLAGAAANGTYGVATVDLTGKAPGWSDYVAAMGKYTKADANSSYAASGYVAGQTLIAALKTIKGTVDAASVIKALEGQPFETLAGTIRFTSSSHLGASQLYLTQVRDGMVTLTGKVLPTT